VINSRMESIADQIGDALRGGDGQAFCHKAGADPDRATGDAGSNHGKARVLEKLGGEWRLVMVLLMPCWREIMKGSRGGREGRGGGGKTRAET